MAKKVRDLNESLVNDYIESIRPKDKEIRKQVDLGYSYDGKIFKLFEIRPAIDDPESISHFEFAKIRYYKSRGEWNLYWKRASGKWEAYEPNPIATHLEELLNVIEEDALSCFYG